MKTMQQAIDERKEYLAQLERDAIASFKKKHQEKYDIETKDIKIIPQRYNDGFEIRIDCGSEYQIYYTKVYFYGNPIDGLWIAYNKEFIKKVFENFIDACIYTFGEK